ncbi:MAG: phage Gp37/Gp68 family protein [Ignavibacteriales bacterium]|nr:phage Gp37/Gp68 family protein [Ignavibacteriales bacterium]
MSLVSTIEWTDSTWNPVTGCTKTSPGCKHCYAETFAERFRGVVGHPYEQGFDLRLWPDRLELPSKWKNPRRIFVNSMSDLFHERVSDEYILRVFEVMIKADHHIFQVLTKRSARLKEWTRRHFRAINQPDDGRRVLPTHIWLGVSVENQKYVKRVRDLQAVPARVRFISVEPLLDNVRMAPAHLRRIHWVIVGGESGPKARPMKEQWVRNIQTACQENNVPFFFKQWGAFDINGKRVGKKLAGRELSGRTWDQMPVILSSEVI